MRISGLLFIYGGGMLYRKERCIYMRFLKALGNFLGVILSLAVSLALLVMLVATPMLSGVAAFTRPETISQVVQEIDFAQLLLENFEGEMTDEERQEMDFLIELTETNAFKDLMELYAIDITNAFEETRKPTALTREALRRIMNENMDELIEIVRKIGEKEGEDTTSYTDEEIAEEVRKTFEEVVDRFLEIVPTVDDLRNLMAKISREFSTDMTIDGERPNSSARPEEDTYDEPSFEYGDGENEGGGTITYIPGDGGTITNVIINSDGTFETENGSFTYIVDENGNVIFQGGAGSGAVSGGTIGFGKPVAIRNGTIRVLMMGVGPLGSAGEEEQDAEIADWVLKLAVMAKNGTLTLLFVGVIAVLALLICLLRWPRFKGLMWVAVMLLIGAVFVALAGVAMAVMPGIFADSLGVDGSVLQLVKPVIGIVSGSMYIAAAIYAGVAIVLIVLFALLRKALKKQKAARAAAAARTDAIEEIADEAEAEVLAVEACEETCEEAPAEETEAETVEAAEEMPCEEGQAPAEEEKEPSEDAVPAE